MADKKLVEAITSRDEDFTQWYTDVVKKAELMEVTYDFLVIQTVFAPPGIGAKIYKTGVIGQNDEHQTGKAGQ